MEKFLLNTKYWILNTIVLIFPFFFLPFTQEFFLTNKLYLLAFSGLVLLLILAVGLITEKKSNPSLKSLDLSVAIFILAVLLSTLISSSNKIGALLNLNLGFIMVLSLGIIYFFLSRSKLKVGLFELISLVLSLVTIIFFFNPLAKVSLSYYLQFLKNPAFTPVGSQLDLAVFLGFFLIFNVVNIILNYKTKERPSQQETVSYSLLFVNFVALGLTVYHLLSNGASVFQLILPPWNLSWYASLEVLKNLQTGLFGAGIGNFSSVFSRVKDLAYNQSVLWQINSFNTSRSAVLHILTETGLFGLGAFCFVVFSTFKKQLDTLKQPSQKNQSILTICLFTYLLICLIVFPPSFLVLFLFFVILALTSGEKSPTDSIPVTNNLINNPVVHSGLSLLLIVIVGVSSYFLGRSYLAEYFFQKSIQGIVINDAKITYENMRQARILNPYEERYIINFSQTNLIIANNLAKKPADQITTNDRQTIAQAVQAAISEAKELIRLNPQKAQYWENLAIIYKNIISIATGANTWTISSYQRAMVLDPTNPSYALDLGGTYYILGQYDQASRFFEQAVADKPNWSNAYYNLAWSYFQSKQYDKAVNAMQGAISLLNKKADAADWDKANSDLSNFKKKLEQAQQSNTSGDLNLPASSSPTLSPKIDLPKEASPEAK